ncbi:MAG: ABC transporter transmembrane domain-containing protein, partial [Turicibacter sp.]
MFKLLKFLKGSAKFFAIIAPLSMLLEVGMDLLQPLLLSQIIDVGVANGDLSYVLRVGFFMFIIAIVGLIAGGACSAFAAIAAMEMAKELRLGVFDKIQNLSFLDIDKLKTSSLITRLTNDVTQVQTMVNVTLKMAVRAPIMCIGGIALAITISPKLAFVFGVS